MTYDAVRILLLVVAGLQIAILVAFVVVFFVMAANISAIRRSVDRIYWRTPDRWLGCAVEACTRNGSIQAKDSKWYCENHYHELFG